MYFDETAWVAIAFLLFFVLVWKKGKKAILSLLDERSLLIEKELNEAKSLKEEALEELRLALQNQKNVSDEAENLIKNAKETAKKIQEEANLKSLEMIKRKEEQAKQKILSLEAEAIKNIKEITSNIVIESSKAYIKQKLDNKLIVTALDDEVITDDEMAMLDVLRRVLRLQSDEHALMVEQIRLLASRSDTSERLTERMERYLVRHPFS